MAMPGGTKSLDIHARPFVPQSLLQVNRVPAIVLSCTPPPWTDYASYVRTFAGNEFLSALLPFREGDIADQQESSPFDANQEVTTSSYGSFFTAAVKEERRSQQIECDEHALYRVPLTPAGNRDPRGWIYWLYVPGLGETDLRIEIGDVVQLRQLRFEYGEVVPPQVVYLTDPQGNLIVQPHSSDKQHDATVWSIDRRRETLSLRVGPLAPGSLLFNACFSVQGRRFDALLRAVRGTQERLSSSTNRWMSSMLFPEESDGRSQKTLNKKELSFKPHDALLNWEQLRGIDTILKNDFGHVPYVISGPPGTGKTKTIVELALQLLARPKTAHLLLCAPSDPASDTLVERLSKHLNPRDLLRLNSPARSFPEVSPSILAYCHVQDDIFSLPPFTDMMLKKIVVVTCRDAELLLQVRLANHDLFTLERDMHSALHESNLITPALHWTGLIIDEAAQATEPEALLPHLVVAPPLDLPQDAQHLGPQVVLVGDQHQLGPRTASKDSAIQTSLFERLLARPLYAAHPLARGQSSNGIVRPLTESMLPIVRPPFTNLIRNYRSHPAILATPSSLFYNDTLEPCAEHAEPLGLWSGFPNHDMPVLFACNSSPDQVEVLDGGGWLNHGEAYMAMRYVDSLLAFAPSLRQSDICIMSPFRAQVRHLRQRARSWVASGSRSTLTDVNIGPLEAFQGLESRVVILCTTRTQDRFIDQDIARGLGVIHEPRRFNVALTRAKEALIVIGNPQVLRQDDSWTPFMAFCARNGCWEGDGRVPGEYDNFMSKVSRLETQLLQPRRNHDVHVDVVTKKMRNFGIGRGTDYGIWESGVAAEAALRDDDDEEVEGEDEIEPAY